MGREKIVEVLEGGEIFVVGFPFKGEGAWLGCDRAVAADLDLSVDGPLVRSTLFEIGFEFFACLERAATIF